MYMCMYVCMYVSGFIPSLVPRTFIVWTGTTLLVYSSLKKLLNFTIFYNVLRISILIASHVRT
jgi:hypothetical protein